MHPHVIVVLLWNFDRLVAQIRKKTHNIWIHIECPGYAKSHIIQDTWFSDCKSIPQGMHRLLSFEWSVTPTLFGDSPFGPGSTTEYHGWTEPTYKSQSDQQGQTSRLSGNRRCSGEIITQKHWGRFVHFPEAGLVRMCVCWRRNKPVLCPWRGRGRSPPSLSSASSSCSHTAPLCVCWCWGSLPPVCLSNNIVQWLFWVQTAAQGERGTSPPSFIYTFLHHCVWMVVRPYARTPSLHAGPLGVCVRDSGNNHICVPLPRRLTQFCRKASFSKSSALTSLLSYYFCFHPFIRFVLLLLPPCPNVPLCYLLH